MRKSISNAEISLFIKLVDEVRGHSDKIAGNPTETTDPSSVIASQNSSVSESNALYQQIHAIILRTDDEQGPNIHQLQAALTKRSILDPSISPYRSIVFRLGYGTPTDKRVLDLSDHDAWIAAIKLLDKLPDLNPKLLGWERDIAVATAVKNLRDRGYKIDPHEAGLQYQPGELDRACAEVHRLASEIGGYNLLVGLFGYLKKTVQMEQGRYLIARPSRSPTGGSKTPSFPFGYLLQVAFKHLRSTANSKTDLALANELEKLATDIVASLDVEHYYILTPMFQTAETIPEFLQEISVGEHVLTIRQITPADALAICRGVFSWIDEELMRRTLGWGPKDACLLAEHTLLRTPPEAVNETFTRHALISSGLREQTLEAMRPYFAHKPTDINVEYVTPLNANKANALLKPFVALPDGSLMLPSPPVSATGFYEAIATGARAVFGNEADSKIGKSMERLLSDAFESRGIVPSVTSKKYKIEQGSNPECDLVVECESAVILIELKKKSLKAESYSGNPLSASLDLCLSALALQKQLGRHELRLREHGRIEFLDGTIVELKERRVERIAVSLFDWGGTQDRFVLQRIAENLVGATLSASGLSEEQAKHIAEANKTLDRLQTQMLRLRNLGVEDTEQIGSWWFLSVPQLLFLLHNVKGPDAFYADLRLVRSVYSGHMDFYKDLTYWRHARENAKLR